MHLGSIYLIVNDFEKSIDFYEKLLQVQVRDMMRGRFAIFNLDGHCLALMNGHFDTDNPDKVIHKGEHTAIFDDLKAKALATNTQKFVLNFWDEDLEKEFNRVKNLNITTNLTKIKYVCNVNPYYYFQFLDPDNNIIEVTGEYSPKKGEFDE